MNTLRLTVWPKMSGVNLVVMEETRPGSVLPDLHEGKLRLDKEVLLAASSDEEYGEELGRGLFADLQAPFAVALNNAAQDAARSAKRQPAVLRVLLRVEDDDLRRLHWERLCMPLDGDWIFLSGHQGTPFSFYLRSRASNTFPPIGPQQLRALLLVAGPGDLGITNPELEFDVPEVVAAVTGGMKKAGIEMDVLARADLGIPVVGKPDLPTLVECLTGERYKLLHIVCHGGSFGEEEQYTLLLSNGEGRPTTQGEFVAAFSKLRPGAGLPYFTFLMACHSAAARRGKRRREDDDPGQEGDAPRRDDFGGFGQQLVRQFNLPAVLAMTGSISISTANKVAASFYPALTGAAAGHLDLALSQSLVTLGGQFDRTVPVLYTCLDTLALFLPGVDSRPLEDLKPHEIRRGLELFQKLIVERAPVLKPEVDRLCQVLDRYSEMDPAYLQDETARQERREALDRINQRAAEVLEVNFNALVQNAGIPKYDGRCPFPGLLRFDLNNKDFFFGRDQLVKELASRICEFPFLAVLGLSGTGKSSVVLAGLAPALGATSLPGYLTPTQSPLAQLDAALARLDAAPEQPRLLVVDQFEELFTLCKDPEQRETFVARILALVGPPAQPGRCRVLITLRADFYGECATFTDLKEEMQKHHVLLSSMNPVELTRAMEQQADVVGLKFEEGLSELILRDLQDAPGAMPLLQFALNTLWQRRHGRWLLRSEYESFGGIRGVITSRANACFDGLSPERQALVREIFIRLTRLDESPGVGLERHDTRQRVPLHELVPEGGSLEDVRDLVSELEDQRLVVRRDDMVEVAHEALIASWEKLRGWLDADRAVLRLFSEVRRAAGEWASHEQADPNYLVHRGGRLEEALALGKAGIRLNAQEAAYLNACQELERERLSLKAQALQDIMAQQAFVVRLGRAIEASSAANVWQVNLDTSLLNQLTGDVPAYGQALADMLLPPGSPARAQFEKARAAKDGLLALRIGISDDYEILHCLDWEAMSESALLNRLPVTRLMDSAEVAPRSTRNLRALAVLVPPEKAAGESGSLHWNGAEEAERIRQQIGAAFSLTCVNVEQAGEDALPHSFTDPYDLLYLHAPLKLSEGLACYWQKEGLSVSLQGLLEDLQLSSRPPRFIVVESNLPAPEQPIPSLQRGLLLEQLRMLEGAKPLFVLWLPEGLPKAARDVFLPGFFASLLESDYVEGAFSNALQAARQAQASSRGLPVLFTQAKAQSIWHKPKGYPPVLLNLWKRLDSQQLIPVVGPGVTESVLGASQMFALRLAIELGIPEDSIPLLRLPELLRTLAINRDRQEAHQTLASLYGDQLGSQLARLFGANLDPAEYPRIIEDWRDAVIVNAFQAAGKTFLDTPLAKTAALPARIFITTNFDPLLACALSALGKNPKIMTCMWNDGLGMDAEETADSEYWPTVSNPLVFSLFGSLHKQNSLVLTNEDYFDLLLSVNQETKERPAIPPLVRSAMSLGGWLLLGYETESMELQVVSQLLRSYVKRSMVMAGAVQQKPFRGAEKERSLSDRMRRYMLDVLWGDVEDVLEDLNQYNNEAERARASGEQEKMDKMLRDIRTRRRRPATS